MNKLSILILAILVAAQIAVPLSMIRSKEKILREGQLFRFKTRPIDPADPFQGRYVRLGFASDFIPWPAEKKSEIQSKEPLYALIEVDQSGFARFTGWSRNKPASGAYLRTRYRRAKRVRLDHSNTWRYEGFYIQLPFDRFYMDEAKAPRAQTVVRESTRSTDCWANVRILDGKAALEDVIAQGKSLRELAIEKE